MEGRHDTTDGPVWQGYHFLDRRLMWGRDPSLCGFNNHQVAPGRAIPALKLWEMAILITVVSCDVGLMLLACYDSNKPFNWYWTLFSIILRLKHEYKSNVSHEIKWWMWDFKVFENFVFIWNKVILDLKIIII